MTEPHAAPIFDTGPHPTPMTSRAGDEPDRKAWYDASYGSAHIEPVEDIFAPTDVLVAERDNEATPAPAAASAHPVVVPGQYQFLKAWKLLSVLCGVWLVAGVIGLGLYYWWFQSTDKSWTEFAVLMYVIVSVVSALLLSLPDQRPVLSATAIAVLTAPYASAVAAGALYGMFAYGWLTP
jgi:hypothetical protein